MNTSLLLAFVGIKVALALLFWRAAVKGLALGERIEARKRAEREAAQAAVAVNALRPAGRRRARG